MIKSLVYIFTYLFVILSVVQCPTVSFNSQNGQWNTASNWVGGAVPAVNDDVKTCYSSNQKCFSSLSKIGARTIEVGSASLKNCIFQSDKYGIEAEQLIVNYNSSSYISIKQDPAISGNSNYYVNLKTILVKGKFITDMYYKANPSLNSTIQVHDGGLAIIDATTMDIYMVNGLLNSIVSFQVDTVATLQGLRGNSSLTSITDSSVSIANNYLGLSTNFNNSAKLQCLNSSFVCHDVMNLYGKSEVFFRTSNVSFIDDNANLFDTVGIYVEQGSSIFVRDSTFYSDKFIGNFDSYIDFDNSKAVINNDYFLFGDSILVVDKTNLTINHQLSLKDDTWVLIQNSSYAQVFGSIFINDEGLINGNRSTITIKSKKEVDGEVLVLQLKGNGQLFFYEQSTVILESNINAGGNSTIGFNSSFVNFNSVAFFNTTSKFIAKQGSTVILDHNLTMIENSTMYLENSSINIRGSIDFYNNAFLTMRQSTCNVNGYFSDRTSPVKQYYLAIINSKFSVNGNLYSTGNIKLDNSTLECANSFVITGGLVAGNNTNIIIKNGNFSVSGVIRISNSSVELKNGFIEFNENSNSRFENSVITLGNGDMKIHIGSRLTLLNTTLINLNAAMNISGDIIINKNSKMINGALFTLNSNILPANNTGSESFNNQGTLNIAKGENETIIMVPFFNNNGTVNVGRETTMFSFFSNGGVINLNPSATLHSNMTFVLNGSSLQGTGVINSSVSSSGGSTIGNNEVTTLTIDGDLDSDQDQFVITIGSKSSTVINVGNNATINNATFVIRIPTNLPETKQNTTIINSTNLNGNGAGKIIFKTYDPSTGVEKDLENCAHELEINRGSLGLLLNKNSERCVVVSTTGGTGDGQTVVVVDTDDSSSLSKGAIIGIIVGVVGAAAIVAVIIHFRNKLPTAQRLTFKLKNLDAKA